MMGLEPAQAPLTEMLSSACAIALAPFLLRTQREISLCQRPPGPLTAWAMPIAFDVLAVACFAVVLYSIA